jgi:hypothetical protein
MQNDQRRDFAISSCAITNQSSIHGIILMRLRTTADHGFLQTIISCPYLLSGHDHEAFVELRHQTSFSHETPPSFHHHWHSRVRKLFWCFLLHSHLDSSGSSSWDYYNSWSVGGWNLFAQSYTGTWRCKWDFIIDDSNFIVTNRLETWLNDCNHEYSTLSASASQRVQRWMLIVDEFAPTIQYLPGVHSTIADALSRPELNIVSASFKGFPNSSSTYPITVNPSDINHVLAYYHKSLLHPGTTKLYQTLRPIFTWEHLYYTIVQYNNCQECQVF